MSSKNRTINLTVYVQGADIDHDGCAFLIGWLKAATYAALNGHHREMFNFTGNYEDDIKVYVSGADVTNPPTESSAGSVVDP